MSTIVALHAHPDDEVILTGGTLARAAADGHRVVVVTAASGMGAEPDRLRLAELRASAAILGVARVECLAYADSGHGPDFYPDPPGRIRFARADVDRAADRVAAILREERADVLIGYDPNGGYRHRDHVQVHRVARRAAQLAATTPRLLEATVPRELVARALGLARLARIPIRYDEAELRRSFTPRAQIAYRFDVRRFAARKQAALAAHRTQVEGTSRTASVFGALVRLPTPMFGLLFGHEWFGVPER